MNLIKILFITIFCNTYSIQSRNISNVIIIQNPPIIYSLNEYVTSNLVKEGQEVPWDATKRVQSSYILIQQNPDGLIYLKVTINGQFAYGAYFKYLSKVGDEYKYIRIDETAKQDYLFINYPLKVLSESQKYDEGVIMKILNYQTSYGILFKF